MTSSTRAPRDRRRSATIRIEEVIEKLVSDMETSAKAAGEPFERTRLPGTKKELADYVNAALLKENRRSAATLDAYFERLSLRWPTNARRGGLTDLRTRVGLATGKLGDVALRGYRPISP